MLSSIGIYGIVPVGLLSQPWLTINALKVYTAIASYQGGNGSAWPSRQAIANRAGLSTPEKVSKATALLEEHGWIKKTSRASQNKTTVYEIRVPLTEDPVPETDPVPESGTPPVPESGTSLYCSKRTNENTSGVPSEQAVKKESNTDEDAAISYLNEKAEVKFRFTESNRKLIRARYKEGFTIEDAKQVIDCKVNAWRESDMAKYLRPVTLFGNKFESYLMEAKKSAPTPSKKMEVDDDAREYYESFGIRV